jgi:hypothetical protein
LYSSSEEGEEESVKKRRERERERELFFVFSVPWLLVGVLEGRGANLSWW